MTDTLSLHLAALTQLDWCCPPDGLAGRLSSLRPFSSSANRPDTHGRFIAKWDAGRDFHRAARMQQALKILCEWATCSQPVCWAALEEIQQVVLGQERASFRCRPAWAKGGQECYGYWPGLKNEFARKIATDDADGAHPVAKAVRLYLDLCFFHPFADGNARAARLWFAYLLRREGHEMAFVEPLFVVERFAGDLAAYVDFLRLAVLSCELGQRHLSQALPGDLAGRSAEPGTARMVATIPISRDFKALSACRRC